MSEHVDDNHVTIIRQAIGDRRKMKIAYRDQSLAKTSRIVWPFAMESFGDVCVFAAWCELRDAFRHFRVDRIAELIVLNDCYSRSRDSLLADWRREQGLDESRKKK